MLLEIANAQALVRERAILSPSRSNDDVLEKEYVKGEASGIRTFMKIPDNFLAGVKAKEEESQLNEGEDDVSE